MAHYVRTTPPVRPPGRPPMPDQPWTAWWEIDDTQLQAPREIRHGAPGTAARNADTAEHQAGIAVAPEAAEPVPVDYDADPYEFPHVDATGGGDCAAST